MKLIVALLFCCGIVHPAYAGFEVIQTKKSGVVDVAKLRQDLDKVVTDLASVKLELQSVPVGSVAYDVTSAKLDVLQTKMTAILGRMKQIDQEKVKQVSGPATSPLEPAAVPKVHIRPQGLQIRTGMTFPKHVVTVKDLALYLLDPIDYKLVIVPVRRLEAMQIFGRIVPKEISDGSIKTIEDALLLAAGKDVNLVIDQKNKMVTFEYTSDAKFQ